MTLDDELSPAQQSTQKVSDKSFRRQLYLSLTMTVALAAGVKLYDGGQDLAMANVRTMRTGGYVEPRGNALYHRDGTRSTALGIGLGLGALALAYKAGSYHND